MVNQELQHALSLFCILDRCNLRLQLFISFCASLTITTKKVKVAIFLNANLCVIVLVFSRQVLPNSRAALAVYLVGDQSSTQHNPRNLTF